MAQLELDAHQRSEEILADAKAQAGVILTDAQVRADAQDREAESRAEVTVAQAQARARQLLEEAEGRIEETAAHYDQLFQSFTAITGHITGELRKLDVTASQLPISFNRLKEGLAELREQARERPEDDE